MTWAEKLYKFYTNLIPPKLPPNVEWLYPQKDPEVLKIVKVFLNKYYNDINERILLLGINPGRYGAGITGVNFTAPKQLTEECNIEHHFKMSSELSAEFIYKVINAYGGPDEFYKKFFIGSVCPLGFVKNGININYYDDKTLLATVEPFIIDTMNAITTFNFSKDNAICIGEGKNFGYIKTLNNKYQWFEHIKSLPHPRFIMQYKRKQLDQYIDGYVSTLRNL